MIRLAALAALTLAATLIPAESLRTYRAEAHAGTVTVVVFAEQGSPATLEIYTDGTVSLEEMTTLVLPWLAQVVEEEAQ